MKEQFFRYPPSPRPSSTFVQQSPPQVAGGSDDWTEEQKQGLSKALSYFKFGSKELNLGLESSGYPDLMENIMARVPGKTRLQIVVRIYSLVGYMMYRIMPEAKEILERQYGLLPMGIYQHTTTTTKEQQRTGEWSEEERALFNIGLNTYGWSEWTKIAENFVKTRTPEQVRSYSQLYLERYKRLAAKNDHELIDYQQSDNGGELDWDLGAVVRSCEASASSKAKRYQDNLVFPFGDKLS